MNLRKLSSLLNVNYLKENIGSYILKIYSQWKKVGRAHCIISIPFHEISIKYYKIRPSVNRTRPWRVPKQDKSFIFVFELLCNFNGELRFEVPIKKTITRCLSNQFSLVVFMGDIPFFFVLFFSYFRCLPVWCLFLSSLEINFFETSISF